MSAPINARIGWVVIGLMLWLIPPGPLFGNATDVLTYDLQQAREQLRINLVFRDRIAAEMQTLKLSKRADPATVAAYEAYLNQVQAMVAEERKTVAQLEALNAKYAARQRLCQRIPISTPNIPWTRTYRRSRSEMRWPF